MLMIDVENVLGTDSEPAENTVQRIVNILAALTRKVDNIDTALLTLTGKVRNIQSKRCHCGDTPCNGKD